MASGDESGQQKKLIVAVVLFSAAGLWAYFQFAGGSNLAADSRNRPFICAKTGQSYDYTIKEGDSSPYMSPYTNEYTGYLAEKCYWMKDENGDYVAKTTPTMVLLNEIFEPGAETICPDCGKEVVGHNPWPPQELMEAAKAAGR